VKKKFEKRKNQGEKDAKDSFDVKKY